MGHKLILVSHIIGDYGITLDDGDTLYNTIAPLLSDGFSITLDFQNVTIFASPFFNASIGRLFATFSEDFLKTNLNRINLSSAGQGTLHRVIENAKVYYGSAVTQEAVDFVLSEQAIAV
jgi:STAS-like domain of unknown function (DUF4325)